MNPSRRYQNLLATKTCDKCIYVNTSHVDYPCPICCHSIKQKEEECLFKDKKEVTK